MIATRSLIPPKFFLICNSCYNETGLFTDMDQLLEESKKQGWTRVFGEGRPKRIDDHCSQCNNS